MEWVLLCIVIYVFVILAVTAVPLVWSHVRPRRQKKLATLDNAEIIKHLRKIQKKKEGK